MIRMVGLLLWMLTLSARADTPTKATAAEALGQILHDNSRFVATHDKAYFAAFRDEQHPGTTLVTCSDSRVHTHALDAHPDGELFVIRNIGNQLDLTGGSVEYGVRHLHTPLLLIVGHVSCGAVKAAMGDYSDEPASIRRELDGLHLSIKKTESAGAFDVRWQANVIGNVHQQVANALLAYKEEIREGRLHVVGAVYDFRNDLAQGDGKLVIVNVDGEKDPAKLAASPLIKEAGKRAH
jgi:carbonic anhydrase